MEVPWQRIRGMFPWRSRWLIINSPLINSWIHSSVHQIILLLHLFACLRTLDCIDDLSHLHLKLFPSVPQDRRNPQVISPGQPAAEESVSSKPRYSSGPCAHKGNHLFPQALHSFCSTQPVTPSWSLTPPNYRLRCSHIFYSIYKGSSQDSVSPGLIQHSAPVTAEGLSTSGFSFLPSTSL